MMMHSHRTTRVDRGFTLAEMMVTISVIFLLMGVALVSYRAAANQARLVSDRALVNGLKIAVGEFSKEFGFVPPMVKDTGGQSDSSIVLVQALPIPAVYSPVIPNDMEILRGESDEYDRYSNYSLAYYLIGALDSQIDGIDGPGFVEVRRGGRFAPVVVPETVPGRSGEQETARRGPKQFEPLFDTDRGGVDLFIDTQNRLTITGAGGTLSRNRVVYRTEIRDRNNIAVRFYRWYSDEIRVEDIVGGMDSYIPTTADVDFESPVTGLIAYLNVPKLVLEGFGDPLSAEFVVPLDVRNASYAIVAAGANKLFGDVTVSELGSDDALIKRYAENLGLSNSRLQSDASYRAAAIEEARADNIVEVGS